MERITKKIVFCRNYNVTEVTVVRMTQALGTPGAYLVGMRPAPSRSLSGQTADSTTLSPIPSEQFLSGIPTETRRFPSNLRHGVFSNNPLYEVSRIQIFAIVWHSNLFHDLRESDSDFGFCCVLGKTIKERERKLENATVPGLLFGGEMTAEEYRAIFNDKKDWISLSIEEKIAYRARLRKAQLAGSVKLISLDTDIEEEIKASDLARKKKLRDLDASYKAKPKQEKIAENRLSDAETLAANALGISVEEFRKRMGKDIQRAKCEKHGLEYKMTREGVTCPLCDIEEIAAANKKS
jgi:hypothetical protein